MEIVNVILSFWWVIPALLLFWLITRCFVNVKSNQLATVERKYLGKEMTNGRTVALPGEVGIQARILGPGLHFLIPFFQKAKKYPYLVVNDNQIGLVEAITGEPIPNGHFMAKSVECNAFQDGEKFLREGGQKGPQIAIIPPGEHRINPYLFKVKVVAATKVEDNQVGLVEAIAGDAIPPGAIMAKKVECQLFQDGEGFLVNGGQKGPQIDVLVQGMYRINTYLFKVTCVPVTIVNGGHIRMVTAIDGGKIPDGRILADEVQGHETFQKGDVFLQNGGQRGRQIQYLMPGDYRINTMLFKISEQVPWIEIDADQIGIVTTLEGKPITDAGKIAADEIPLNVHSNFQNADEFLKAGGQKGLQIPVLRAGAHPINPWFANVMLKPMTEVKIGQCAVVTCFVGDEGEDTTDSSVNAKIVPNGKKGIWKEPLGPGKHPLNLEICRVNIVPTTQILLSWADVSSSAYKFDQDLKPIVLRTADAFDAKMDVQVMFHIGMENAASVIADLGSVEDMISQVLEPAISSHFRNAAQTVKALELYTKRAELQKTAEGHITKVLGDHHIASKGTMITDVVLPIELTQQVRDAEIAVQEEKKYKTKQAAEQSRKEYEFSKTQADMQEDIVKSERSIEISKNTAKATVETAQGDADAAVVRVEAEAKNTERKAQATATATKVIAAADSEKIEKIGLSEAKIILEKGKSQAEAYNLSVKAMGTDYARLKIIESISASGMKLLPENIIIGGGEGSSSVVENFCAISMIEKMTGKPFNQQVESQKEETPKVTETQEVETLLETTAGNNNNQQNQKGGNKKREEKK